jgi:hypothetical protein
MCLTIAKLTVLMRMMEFFRSGFSPKLSRFIAVCERVAMALVVAATLVMVCCGFACSYYASQVSFYSAGKRAQRRMRNLNIAKLQTIQPLLYFVEVSVLVRRTSVLAAAAAAAAAATFARHCSERFAGPGDNRMVCISVHVSPPHSKHPESLLGHCLSNHPVVRQAVLIAACTAHRPHAPQ